LNANSIYKSRMKENLMFSSHRGYSDGWHSRPKHCLLKTTRNAYLRSPSPSQGRDLGFAGSNLFGSDPGDITVSLNVPAFKKKIDAENLFGGLLQLGSVTFISLHLLFLYCFGVLIFGELSSLI